MERKILLVGDQKLYEISSKVDREELEELRPVFDDMSELIKQEYDHLDGILATMRAIDDKSFVIKK